MDGYSDSNINSAIFVDSITDYASWKKKRQLLASQLGQYLLDYNESQLSSIMTSWESELARISQIKTVKGNMMALLAFSILHFFFRSYDHVKKNFPMVNALTSSENRDVCQAATTTLRYLAEENPDNYTFLRISLESVSSYLKSKTQSKGENKSLYNGLLILRQCGRFIPSDVFEITINTMPEIWSAICSPDRSLQKVAVKVINIHLLHVPSNTAESYAQSLAFDCFASLNSKKSSSYTGFILTLKSIFLLFPKAADNQTLIKKLVNSLSFKTEEIPIETYKFLLLLANGDQSVLSNDQSLLIFRSLLNNIKTTTQNQIDCIRNLLDVLDNFIRSLPKPMVPVTDIIEVLSSSLHSYQNKKIINYNFKIFCTIIELFPQQKIPVNIFTNNIMCKNALRALRKRIDILMEIREQMMKLFNEGLNPRADFFAQKVSLRILSTFQNILFERIDDIFPLLRHFSYSQNEKIRWLFASILHSFSCQEATDEMVRLAMIDESKEVRLCALNQIKAEDVVDKTSQLFQLLADTSYKVRRAAIPLIAAAAQLNPLYIVPQIILFVNNFLVTNVSYKNPARSAKSFSLMPLIGEHFVQFEPQFIPNLTWFCVWLLSHGNPIKDIPLNTSTAVSSSSSSQSSHLSSVTLAINQTKSSTMPFTTVNETNPVFTPGMVKNSRSFDSQTNDTLGDLSLSIPDDSIHQIDLRRVIHRDFLLTTLGSRAYQSNKNNIIYSSDNILSNLNITVSMSSNSYPNSNMNINRNSDYKAIKEEDEAQQKTDSSNHLESHSRLLLMVYKVENSKWIAKCDSFLFNTLQMLSRYLRPYIYQVIPVFIYTFTYNQKEIVYLAALDALRQIIIEDNAEINLFAVFPYLLPSILRLIASSKSKEIIIRALKLTGTIGVSSTVTIERDNENSYTQLISIQNMSFFTHFVLKLLCEHFKEPSVSVCDSFSMIFAKDPVNAMPFLEKVINAFISVINRETDVDVLFNELELIILHTKMNIVPYLNSLLQLLSTHLTNLNCIRCCISLSYHLKTEFTDCATVLYPSVLHDLSKNNNNLFFKTVLKFISYAIIFQNQNPELFIEQVEFQLLGKEPLDDIKTASMLVTVKNLVQLRKLPMYSSRISRVCFALLFRCSLNEVVQLIFCLCQFEDLSIDIVELFLNNTGLKIPSLSNIRSVIEASNEREYQSFASSGINGNDNNDLGRTNGNNNGFNNQVNTNGIMTINLNDNSHTESSSSSFQSGNSSSLKSNNSSNEKKFGSKLNNNSKQNPGINSKQSNEDRNANNYEDDDFNDNSHNNNENEDFNNNNPNNSSIAMNTSKGIFKAPVLTTSHLDYLVCESPIESAFTNLKQPVFNNARVWIDELCTRVVKNSPSVAIRSCVNAIAQSQSFRDELFPFAFLSCWMSTFRIQDKTQFSKTIVMILENFEKIDPIIIILADLADRVRFPLRVPDTVLAKASQNPCLSLYFLQRYLRDNPDSKSTIQSVLELNSRMGYLDSARGILIAYSSKLSELEKGKWYEQLGEWEKALEIFEKQIQNPLEIFETSNSISNDKINEITALIQCYAHLEMWDKIRALEKVFDKMPLNAKKENALWFSCAEYDNANIEKAQEFLLSDHTNESIDTILYKTIYSIRSGDYENASNYIIKGFEILAENNSIFDGSDASEATRSMVYAQHFVELNEALLMKKCQIKSIHKIWQNRIKNFSHESDAWIRMIEVRGLVLRPEEHVESYLKMVSVLRKERKWRLIDSYCEKFLHNIKSPEVVISRLKNLWARGEKEEALGLIKLLNRLFESNDENYFKKVCEHYNNNNNSDNLIDHSVFPKIGQVTFDMVQNYKKEYKIDQKFMARAYRIQANWQYKMYNSSYIRNSSPLLALTKISRMFEKSKDLEPNDSRTWAGWAYANSRALSHATNEDRPKYAFNAISGFLKATQLRPSESLEYLCQMFSIFFRYGVEPKKNQQLHDDIVSLPPSIIVQIIPQIVVHISHHDINIRKLVQDVIYVFGSDHFETVVYPLNVLSMIDDSEISFTAKSFMNSLGMMHGHVPTYLDAQLLIQGMHKAAVSWLENWITTLETASKAQKRGNKEMVIKILNKQFESYDESYGKNYLFSRSSQKLTSSSDIVNDGQNIKDDNESEKEIVTNNNNSNLQDKETQCNNIPNFLLIDQNDDLGIDVGETDNSSYTEYLYNRRKTKSGREKNELCEFDRLLSRQYANPLIQCRSAFEKYKNGNDSIVKQMWDNFRALYNEFGNQMKKITSIMLNKISPELANKRGFNLAIPGTYEVLKNSSNSSNISINKYRTSSTINLSSAVSNSSNFYLYNGNSSSNVNSNNNNNNGVGNHSKQNNNNNNNNNNASMTNLNYQNSDINNESGQQDNNDGNQIPQLYYIEPELQVLSTQAHPRSVYMVDTFGNRCKFLLKGNEDLRLDQRIMQFFKLINSLLAANRNTSDLGTSISQYAVVPFAPNAGFISWVTGSDTLQVLVSEYRSHWHIKKNIEIDIYTQFCGPIYNHLNSCQKHEVFNEVASKQNAGELREMLWLRSPSPAAWLRRSKTYTISTALMSMAGYTIGLGDRHPSNIMIQKHTGRVIHIDFGDSFEVAMNRKTFKERVPFRLTRMILNALDGERVDGLFRTCCENVLWVLRENQSSIIAQLEVFVHEPIFYGREIVTSEAATSMILERVSKKLNGKDPLPFDAPEDKVLNVEEQVSTLIQIAADPKEYDRHFLGWCPFW